MTLSAPQPQDTIVGTGQLSYTMNVQVGPQGGDTIVNINANHSFEDITPK